MNCLRTFAAWLLCPRAVCKGVLTVGIAGSNVGFTEGLNGSISNNRLFYKGYEAGVRVFIIQTTGASDLTVQIQSPSTDPTQSAFSKIVIEDGSGTTRTFLTSAADAYSYVTSSRATWTWGDGSTPVYESGDDTETHPYAIVA